MNLKNKFKGLPTIYYFNLDNIIERREYMESQFDRWKIKDFKRISNTKYLASQVKTWKHLLNGDYTKYAHTPGHLTSLGNSLNHLETIKNWLETTNDQYLILMEDDYDLNLFEYWNFDWEYLMNNIPYDWDCIQLGFESQTYINFFLHPKPPIGTFFGACLINRLYAEKLVKLNYTDSKVNLFMKTNDKQFIDFGQLCTIDYFICSNGRTYCIPLITCNTTFGSGENNIMVKRDFHDRSRDLYYDWWQNEHHKFSLDDFFTYGKPNDHMMTRKVNTENKNKILYS